MQNEGRLHSLAHSLQVEWSGFGVQMENVPYSVGLCTISSLTAPLSYGLNHLNMYTLWLTTPFTCFRNQFNISVFHQWHPRGMVSKICEIL